MNFRICWLVLVLFGLSACGFQLRGNYALPAHLKQVGLRSADPYSAITRQIGNSLKYSGVNLVSESETPLPIIELGEEKLERSNLSLYPDGQVAEYRLLYQLSVTLRRPEQPPEVIQLQVQRDYLDNPSEALAKRREMEMLLTEMRQQLADQLIIKLAAY